MLLSWEGAQLAGLGAALPYAKAIVSSGAGATGAGAIGAAVGLPFLGPLGLSKEDRKDPVMMGTAIFAPFAVPVLMKDKKKKAKKAARQAQEAAQIEQARLYAEQRAAEEQQAAREKYVRQARRAAVALVRRADVALAILRNVTAGSEDGSAVDGEGLANQVAEIAQQVRDEDDPVVLRDMLDEAVALSDELGQLVTRAARERSQR